MKGKDNAKTKDWIIAGVTLIILLIVAVQTFQINSLKQEIARQPGGISSAASGSESYEEMMARMHPELANSNSAGGMVGGC